MLACIVVILSAIVILIPSLSLALTLCLIIAAGIYIAITHRLACLGTFEATQTFAI
jgi:hypothetical protein